MDLSAVYWMMPVSFVTGLFLWQFSSVYINWFWGDIKKELTALENHELAKIKLDKSFKIKPTAVLLIINFLVSLAVYLQGLDNIHSILMFSITMFIITITLIDYRTLIIPDSFIYFGIWSILVLNSIGISLFDISLAYCIQSIFLGYMTCWIIIHSTKILLGNQVYGHGDAKYIALTAGIIGFKACWPILLLSPVFAGIFITFYHTFIQQNYFNPYSPFMTITMLAILFNHKEYYDLYATILGYIKNYI